MKMTLKITSAVALIVGIVAVSSGAFATDTREAIKMCDKNPKCKMTSAGIDFIILHVHGGGTVVCPMINGPCQTRTSGNHRFDHIGEGGNAQVHENSNTGGGTNGNVVGGTIF